MKRLIISLATLLVLSSCSMKSNQDQQDLVKAENSMGIGAENPSQTAKNASEKDKRSDVKTINESKQATTVTSWELSGVMAARSKNKSWSASVNWVQRGLSSYQIRLFGPVGSGTVMIERNGGMVLFKDGAKSASSKNADQLLMQQTGVRLPVNHLYYWVRGLPAPGPVQTLKKDDANRLLVLRQDGYTIQYEGYMTAGQTVLPRKITLQGNGVFVKLVVKHWRA